MMFETYPGRWFAMIKSLEEKNSHLIIKEALLILIDDAIDRNDRTYFLMLSKELKELEKVSNG